MTGPGEREVDTMPLFYEMIRMNTHLNTQRSSVSNLLMPGFSQFPQQIYHFYEFISHSNKKIP